MRLGDKLLLKREGMSRMTLLTVGAGPRGGTWGAMAEGPGEGGAQAQVYNPPNPIVQNPLANIGLSILCNFPTWPREQPRNRDVRPRDRDSERKSRAAMETRTWWWAGGDQAPLLQAHQQRLLAVLRS